MDTFKDIWIWFWIVIFGMAMIVGLIGGWSYILEKING
ncbi:hypothetical protein LCGC14_0787840 [marine sediment metagenome]|uniref:Uncharacterized protein n=1 Tax=marine sediment metagenome TaxID=412755 RepID=A0A0F9PTQ3_9ZZZZ